MSQILVNGLRALADHGPVGTVVKFRDLNGLTFSERTSFQKLQYWDLVRKAGGKKNGEWVLTELGKQFLDGEIQLPLYVRTFRNTTIAESIQRIFVSEATRRARGTSDYAADAIPHEI